MKWSRLVLGWALAVIIAAPALAQESKKECECTESLSIGVIREAGYPEVVWVGSRARLGVWVNTEANEETDEIGALIERVTPGGPADKAGIKAGDIVTKLNGESLLRGGGPYEDSESAPGMRLIERARSLERGDTVEVEFRRGDETKTVQLVAGDFAGVDYFSYRGEAPVRMREMLDRIRGLPALTYRGPETFALRLGARLPGLELVSLNPGLGEYFGTSEGVLVVSIPEDSELGLKAGDVIQSIDGRNVRSPSHAMRILRSYDADEEVSFDVLRKKRNMTVKGKVPEFMGVGTHVVEIERQDF